MTKAKTVEIVHTGKNILNKKRKNNETAITLISLIITIIVLIILAGVAINLIVGENGLLKKVEDAKLKYQIEQAKEELDLKIVELQTKRQGTATLNELVDFLKNETDMDYIVSLTKIASITGVDTIGDAKEIYVVYKKYQFKIDDKLRTEFISIVENYTEESNLIAWYDGIKNTNEGHSYNATTWTDLTGNNLTGATINGTTWTQNGLLFDGSSNNWVDMNSILMPKENNFTLDITFSLNKYTSGTYMVLGQIDTSNVTNRTGLSYDNSIISLQNIGNTSTNVNYNYNLKFTEKINITIVRNGNTFELWANGNKINEQTSSGAEISQINTILGKWGSNYYFNGTIYSIKVFNTNLTKTQIEKNYNENNNRFGIDLEDKGRDKYIKDGMMAWYDGIKNTNEGHSYDATTWTDLTGNNLTGATINGTTWTQNGLLFDGSSNNWVNMNSILMPKEDNFTLDITFSLNKYTNGTYMVLGQIDTSNLTNRTGLSYDNSIISLQNIGNTSTNVNYNYNLKFTEKINITIVRNGNTFELWANGNKINEQTSSGAKISQINTILGKWGSNHYFNGVIYSLRVYNRNLSNEEVIQNYIIDKIRFAM